MTRPDTDPRIWSVVLAGGEGIRLQPLTRYVCGDGRPKQYARLLGSRSLLQETVARLMLRIPLERTVVVSSRRHLPYLAEQFPSSEQPWLLMQPEDRGTAAAILLAAHWVWWRDQDAILAVFPADHFVRGESTFMSHVVGAATFVKDRADQLVVMAVRPTDPDPDYGWIETGEVVGRVGSEPVLRVRRFCEKPGTDAARQLLEGGHLWSTFIMLATARSIIALGREHLPLLSDPIDRVAAFAEAEGQADALAEAYANAPPANFSRAILESCPLSLAAARLPLSVTWADWGTPARVVRSLHAFGIVPPWLRGLEANLESCRPIAATS